MRVLDRKIEIPNSGPFSDLMWSDPEDIDYWTCSSRGAGWQFGKKVVEEFCLVNGLKLMCRAH